MPLHVPAFPLRLSLRRTVAAALLGAVLVLLHGLGRTQAQAPPPPLPAAFGPTDFDAVHSDAATVSYRVSRACLADVATCLGQPGQSSLCQLGQPITGLVCGAGIHRFCGAKGHRSGWGVESALDANQVDITCVRQAAAELHTVTPAALQAQHPSCTSAMPSIYCSSAIDRYCRSQPGFSVGFGPVERGMQGNTLIAVVTCIRTAAAATFDPLASEVEALAPGCALGATEVSTACRQAMQTYCASQGGLRGGFGPRELGADVYLGCARPNLPWTANASLPEPPSRPVDILNHRVDDELTTSGLTQWDPEPLHNRLGPARSFSFDGRLYTVRRLIRRTVQQGRFIQFNVQTPEVFTAPLSQRQPPGRDRSFEVASWADEYDFDVPAEQFHGSSGEGSPEGSTTGFDTASVAICDPHQDATNLAHANEQQSVPSRVSNPFACNVTGGTQQGTLDHDCYDVTIVGVFRQRADIYHPRDELWGTPVRVIVANPKRAVPHSSPDPTRARVVGVQIRGTPVMAPVMETPQGLLEPNITGNGRLIVIQREGLIQYSVISPQEGAACDVRQWGTFKNLHEMHTDPEMASYGIAKYPLRDLEDHLVGSFPSAFDRQVRAAYPWIDRDGDNMMFMLGAQGLFYSLRNNGGGIEVHPRYPILGHPVLGNPDWIPTPEGDIPLRPSTVEELPRVSDDLPRVGLVLVGLWTQGKMFSPDNRNNAVDFGVPGGPWHHRNLGLYQNVATEVGTSIRTDINSAENQLFFDPKLRPDTPREVVWSLSTQYPGVTASRENEHPETAGGVTDEVDFDDVIDPRALIVSSMGASIKATGDNRGHFLDGFAWGPPVFLGGLPYEGYGFQRPAHIANSATSVSAAVAASPALAANVQWNVPRFGYLLGGARAEPVAAGGFRGKGLWFDGVDDRLEYIVPPQPASRVAEMASSPWFYNLSIDPRAGEPGRRQRLLTVPDGTWLDLVGTGALEYGRGDTTVTVTLPPALQPRAGRWTTIGIESLPVGSGSEVRLYLDGYLLFGRTFQDRSHFRMQPGLFTVGAASGSFKGWLDDLKVTSHRPGPEVACNHARGTVIGVEPGDRLDERAAAYPASSHDEVSDRLPSDQPHFARYACERPIENPADRWDLASHEHYTCLGQTRRPRSGKEPDKCLREELLFPEGPLFHDRPRPSSLGNEFCRSCHVNSSPSVTMRANAALGPVSVGMRLDVRRQPMQNSPKFFGYLPAGLFGGRPASPFPTPREGIFLDPYTTPSARFPQPQQ